MLKYLTSRIGTCCNTNLRMLSWAIIAVPDLVFVSEADKRNEAWTAGSGKGSAVCCASCLSQHPSSLVGMGSTSWSTQQWGWNGSQGVSRKQDLLDGNETLARNRWKTSDAPIFSQQVQKGPESVHCGVPLQLQGHGTSKNKQTYSMCVKHRRLPVGINVKM